MRVLRSVTYLGEYEYECVRLARFGSQCRRVAAADVAAIKRRTK